MRHERISDALRRAKIVAALRALDGPRAMERARRVWDAARRRPDAVLAAALLTGVLVAMLHWR